MRGIMIIEIRKRSLMRLRDQIDRRKKNSMTNVNFDRINQIESIRTIKDAEKVLAFMIFDANLIFHPDDSAFDYFQHLNKDDIPGERIFSDRDAHRIDMMMEIVFGVFARNEKDIYIWSAAMMDRKKESITLQEYDREIDISDYLAGCKDHTAPCIIASII